MPRACLYYWRQQQQCRGGYGHRGDGSTVAGRSVGVATVTGETGARSQDTGLWGVASKP